MSVTTETPERLRQIYPDFPHRVSEYLELASGGDEQARDTLDAIRNTATFIDPWHRDMIEDMFSSASRSIGDREPLLVRSLVALTAIKAQAQAGAPFVFYGPNFSSQIGCTAGTLGDPEEFTVFAPFPGIQLKPVGVTAWDSRQGGFPQVKLEQGYQLTINLMPERHGPMAWDHLPKIANGTGYAAFGAENVARSIELQGNREKAFYAALALKAAGVELDVRLDEETLDIVRTAAINQITGAANSLGGGHLTRVEKPDLHILFDLAGLTEEQLTTGAYQDLQEVINGARSSASEIARAQERHRNIADLARVLFATEPV